MKSDHLFPSSHWLGGSVFHSIPAQPALSIAQTNSGAILTWPVGATNYILQSATNLSTPNWVTVSNATPGTNLPVAFNSPAKFFRLSQNIVAPAGMALIPAGSFSIGDALDGISSAIPTNVYVSAFFMDTNLVRYDQWSVGLSLRHKPRLWI